MTLTFLLTLVALLLLIGGGLALATRYVKDGPAPQAPTKPMSPDEAFITEEVARLDRIFVEWATGGVVLPEALDDADVVVRRRFELAAKLSGTRDLTRLRQDEQASLFLVAIRAAALGHPAHAAWPVHSQLQPLVAGELLRRASLRPSLALHTALVPAALSVGALEIAVQAIGQLRGHPRLRTEVLGWVRDMLVSAPSQNHFDAIARFLRVVGEKSTSESVLAGPQLRALRFAVLPSPAIDRRTSLADPRPAAVCRAYLRDWYDVGDGPSARERLDFFLRVGVRSTIRRTLTELDVSSADPERERRRTRVAHDHAGYASREALAFDLVRVIEIARLAYAAGHLPESETWEWVFAAARELETRYDGFPSIASDYLRGHAFACRPGGEHDLVELVTYLVRAPTSPWAGEPASH